jgi:hypothetical protein
MGDTDMQPLLHQTHFGVAGHQAASVTSTNKVYETKMIGGKAGRLFGQASL